MPQIIYINSKVIELDGIEYSFSIYRNHERYMGLWNCGVCNHHEMVPLMQPSAETAENLAQEQIAQHHKSVHSPAKSLGS